MFPIFWDTVFVHYNDDLAMIWIMYKPPYCIILCPKKFKTNEHSLATQ